MYVGVQEARKGHQKKETGATSSCEPSDVGAGNLTQILCKNSNDSLIVEPPSPAPWGVLLKEIPGPQPHLHSAS